MANTSIEQKILETIYDHGLRMAFSNKYKKDDEYPHVLMCALASEVGEVLDKINKCSRDSWDIDKYLEAQRKELGDVIWFLGQACLIRGDSDFKKYIDGGWSVNINQSPSKHRECSNPFNRKSKMKLMALSECANIIYASHNFAESLSWTRLTHMISCFCAIIHYDLFIISGNDESYKSRSKFDELTLAKIQTLCADNYVKISDRYNRGVISGSGDNR